MNEIHNYICKCNFWIYIDESNLWWKVPSPNKCDNIFDKCKLYYDNCLTVIQDSKCFRCEKLIKNIYYRVNKDQREGFYYKGNIYCKDCAIILDSNINLANFFIKREYNLNRLKM